MRGSHRTLSWSWTTDANLDCMFVKNTHVLIHTTLTSKDIIGDRSCLTWWGNSTVKIVDNDTWIVIVTSFNYRFPKKKLWVSDETWHRQRWRQSKTTRNDRSLLNCSFFNSTNLSHYSESAAWGMNPSPCPLLPPSPYTTTRLHTARGKNSAENGAKKEESNASSNNYQSGPDLLHR